MGMLGRITITALTVVLFLFAQDFNVGNNTNIPTRLATVAITGRTSAITTTNIIASAPAGLYRISGYMQTTTASAGVCTSDVTLGWTYNSSAKTLEDVSNHNQAVDETYSQIPTAIVRSDASGNITYAVSLDAGGGDCTSAAFAVFVVAERLQ
jgi:hypothetical protein